MQKYVLTTPEKQRLLISQEEYNGVIMALDTNKKYAVIQGHIIPLSIAPTVSPFANWYATENERLANSGKRLCRKCLKQMDIFDKCPCWEVMGKGEQQNAFIASKLPQLMSGWHKWPELTDEDRRQIDEENSIDPSITRYVEDGEIDGYIDPYTGETMYS